MFRGVGCIELQVSLLLHWEYKSRFIRCFFQWSD